MCDGRLSAVQGNSIQKAQWINLVLVMNIFKLFLSDCKIAHSLYLALLFSADDHRIDEFSVLMDLVFMLYTFTLQCTFETALLLCTEIQKILMNNKYQDK